MLTTPFTPIIAIYEAYNHHLSSVFPKIKLLNGYKPISYTLKTNESNKMLTNDVGDVEIHRNCSPCRGLTHFFLFSNFQNSSIQSIESNSASSFFTRRELTAIRRTLFDEQENRIESNRTNHRSVDSLEP